MLSGIDHVVILVRDLPDAVSHWTELGFTVTPGGEHGGGVTHNALIGFQDGTYFELIAFKDPERGHDHRWWPRLAAGEGLIDYALMTDNAAATGVEARSRGLELGQVTDGSRRRPDGTQLAWRSITPGKQVGTTALPFAIEDVTARELRVPAGAAAAHRVGTTGIAELLIAVKDLDVATRDLSAMLGAAPEAVHIRPSGGRQALFRTGRHLLRIAEPGNSYSEEDVALTGHLHSRGEGPCEVVLTLGASAMAAPGTLLPLDATNSARIRVGGVG